MAVKEAVKQFSEQISIICDIEDINKRGKYLNRENAKVIRAIDDELSAKGR